MNLLDHNPHLADLETDYLYHLGLTSKDELKAMFGNVKHVAMHGSADRALAFALKLNEELGPGIDPSLVTPIGKTERFVLYKIGNVISVSHGMGQPSHSILLHEITKLLHYAGAQDFQYYRLGTSGGIGVEAGTVVVSRRGLNPAGEPKYSLYVLGKERDYPTEFDPVLAQEILDCRGEIEAVLGDTVAADDFYIEQGRLDGAFCPITPAQKMNWLQGLYAQGARNMEMEAAGFAAFCNVLEIGGADICVALLNRLHGDQVTSTQAQLAAFADNPQRMLLDYIKKKAAEAQTATEVH